MGIEAITEKIVGEATEYADALIDEANAEAGKIIANAGLEAGEIRERMDERGVKDAFDLKHRKHSAAELESRKLRLAAKQEMVKTVMDAAVDHLASMEQKDYIAFLVGQIVKTGAKEGELILNGKDRSAVGKKLVKAANEALGEGRIALSAETMDAKGGFILRHGAVTINSTLETMVASVKEKVAQKAVRIMIKKRDG
jgi:V/A-type H+-transporting ATPase subunit E